VSRDTNCRVYEQDAIRCVTGEAIRPGGLVLTERALTFLSPPAGARVLDVGCGAGATVDYLLSDGRGLFALGLDPSRLLIRSGYRRNAGRPLLQGQGEYLPIAGGEIDVILAECSLSVMADVDRALAEFRRVLRSGGAVVVSDVYARSPAGIPALRRLPVTCCLRGAVSRHEIAGRLQAHGFRILLWEDHSDVLKQLAVRIIVAHGSMARFWCQATGEHADASHIQPVITRSKPGYFLLVAQKREDSSRWMT
jgi:arsenite methyltransferase